jgi:NAD(P)-dependent dehydrogenase (short-subunit alcohol dehydrogenase family)
MRSLFGLEGKRIVVLGGGQGMGEATVRLLASLGAELAVVDLEASRAERVAAEATAVGARALPFSADVLNDDSLVAAIEKIDKSLGPIDGMATIIGMAAWAPIVETSMDVWDQDHRRNLRYFFLASREVGKRLLARGAPGSIVGVASVDGIRSSPNHASYGAAKAGLINLVKTMAVEWSGQGIRVNLVAPGGIVTPRLPHMGVAEARFENVVPMKRRGTVDDIAKAITIFLSDLTPYVTGQTLAVDGGFEAANVLYLNSQGATPRRGTMGVDA